MAVAKPSAFIQRLAEASKAIVAVTGLLEDVAGLLRQLVHVVGWLILLYGSVSLLLRPHLSPEHLITPGAGALAVIQHHVRPRRPGSRLPVIGPEVPEFGADQLGSSSAADLDSLLEPGQSDGPVAMSSASDPTLPDSLLQCRRVSCRRRDSGAACAGKQLRMASSRDWSMLGRRGRRSRRYGPGGD